MAFDLQTHSPYSDGRNPIAENCRVGEAVGLVAMAVTDHWLGGEVWLDGYLAEIATVRRAHPGLRILSGVEGVIATLEGDISVTAEVAGQLDYVLVDFGKTVGLSRDPAQQRPEAELVEATTRCMIRVAGNPLVDAVSHPLNLGRFGVSGPDAYADGQLELMAEAMADNGVLFDLMNQMYYWYPDVSIPQFTRQYIRVVRRFAGKGVHFALSSDAHASGSVGNTLWCQRVMQEADVPARQLIDPERFTSRRHR